MTAVLHGGLLHEPEVLVDLGYFELPPRIPEEDVIASRGLCRGSQFSGFTDLSQANRKARNRAIAHCNVCPVAAECRVVGDYLDLNVEDPRLITGLYAGEGPAERERRRRNARREAA